MKTLFKSKDTGVIIIRNLNKIELRVMSNRAWLLIICKREG